MSYVIDQLVSGMFDKYHMYIWNCTSDIANPHTPRNCSLDCPFARPVQLRHDHTLELAENRFPIDNRQHDTVAEEQAAQVGGRISLSQSDHSGELCL